MFIYLKFKKKKMLTPGSPASCLASQILSMTELAKP